MKKRLFVIVDMVNGFVKEGNLHDPYINHITEGIKELAQQLIENKDTVLAFKDCHEMTDKEFESYPVHCLKGTSESELVEELRPLETDMEVIPKNTTNGFLEPRFREYYEKYYLEYEEIIVVGCCTDICVADFTTSLAYFHKENQINTPITVPINLVETFDGPNHNRETYNEIGLERMRKAGVNLVEQYQITKGKVKLYETQI